MGSIIDIPKMAYAPSTPKVLNLKQFENTVIMANSLTQLTVNNRLEQVWISRVKIYIVHGYELLILEFQTYSSQTANTGFFLEGRQEGIGSSDPSSAKIMFRLLEQRLELTKKSQPKALNNFCFDLF